MVVATVVASSEGGHGPEHRRRSVRRQVQDQAKATEAAAATAGDSTTPVSRRRRCRNATTITTAAPEEEHQTSLAGEDLARIENDQEHRPARAIGDEEDVDKVATATPSRRGSSSFGDMTLVVEIPTPRSAPASASSSSKPARIPHAATSSPPNLAVSRATATARATSSSSQRPSATPPPPPPAPISPPPAPAVRRSGRARSSISTRTSDFVSLHTTPSSSSSSSSHAAAVAASSSSSSPAASVAVAKVKGTRGSLSAALAPPPAAAVAKKTTMTTTASRGSAVAGGKSAPLAALTTGVHAARVHGVAPAAPPAARKAAGDQGRGKMSTAASAAADTTSHSNVAASPSSASSLAALASGSSTSAPSRASPLTSTFTALSTPTSSHATRSNKSTSVIPFPPPPLPLAPSTAPDGDRSSASLREEDSRDEKLMAVCAALDALGNRALSGHEIADVCVANGWLRPSPAVAAHTLVATAIRNYHRRCQYATPARRPIIQKHMLQGCVAETRLASALHPMAFDDGRRPKGAVWFLEGSLRGHCWTNPLTQPLESMQQDDAIVAGQEDKEKGKARRETKPRVATGDVKVEGKDRPDVPSESSSVHKRMVWPAQHCIDFEVDSSGDSSDDDLDDTMDNERGQSLFSSSSSLSSLPRSFAISRLAPTFPRDSLHPTAYQQDVSVPMLSPYRVEDSSSSSEEDELAEDIQLWDDHASLIRARQSDSADFDVEMSALRVSMADLDAAVTPVASGTGPGSILSSSITSDYLATKVRASPVDEEELHTAVETLGCLLPSPGQPAQATAMDIDQSMSTTPTESPLRSFPSTSAAMKLSLPLAGNGMASPLPSPSISATHAFFGSPQARRGGTASPARPQLELPVSDADLLSDLSRQLAIGGADNECVCKCETQSTYESSSSSQHSLASSIRSPLRGGKNRSPLTRSPRKDASKNLFKLLGPESVGVDELDVVWGPQVAPPSPHASSSSKPRSSRQRSGSTGEWGNIGVGKHGEEDRTAFATHIVDQAAPVAAQVAVPHPTPIVEEDEDAFGMNDLDDACLVEWAERDDLKSADSERSPSAAWTLRLEDVSPATSPPVIDPCTLAMSPDKLQAAASPPLSTAQSPLAEDPSAAARRPLTPSMSPQAEEPSKPLAAPSKPASTLRSNGRSVMVPPTNPVFPKVWATVVDSIPVFAITWQGRTLLRRVDSDYINLTQFLSTTPMEKPELECAKLAKLSSSVSVPTHPVPAVRGLWVPMSQAMQVAAKTVVDDDLKKVLFNDELAQLFPRPLPQVKAAFCSVAASRQSTNGPILPFGLPFGASVVTPNPARVPNPAPATAAARRTSTPAPVTKRPTPPASSPAPAAKRRKSCVAETKPKIAAAPARKA